MRSVLTWEEVLEAQKSLEGDKLIWMGRVVGMGRAGGEMPGAEGDFGGGWADGGARCLRVARIRFFKLKH